MWVESRGGRFIRTSWYPFPGVYDEHLISEVSGTDPPQSIIAFQGEEIAHSDGSPEERRDGTLLQEFIRRGVDRDERWSAAGACAHNRIRIGVPYLKRIVLEGCRGSARL